MGGSNRDLFGSIRKAAGQSGADTERIRAGRNAYIDTYKGIPCFAASLTHGGL